MTKTKPQVSVIIPAYNAAAFLDRAIDSVLAQEGITFEILIVNNNSTDNTVKIATAYASKYPECIAVIDEATPGASAARNCGLKAARGDWIQFLDADDVLLPGKFVRQLQLIKSGANWLLGTIRLRSVSGREVDAIPLIDHWSGMLTYTGMGHLDANLFRKKALLAIGGFNEKYLQCNDFELFLRMLEIYPEPLIDTIPSAVHIHHEGERITNTNQKAMASQRLALTLRIINFLKQENAAYYSENRPFVRSALLNVIRQQFTVDPAHAQRNYEKHFPGDFNEEAFDAEILPDYAFLYPFLGVPETEKLRAKAGRLIPKKILRFLGKRS